MQFKDIVGQRDVINRLTEIIDSGRVSHAQMILGDNEDGSLALALAYLQYLCCTDRQHHEGGELRADSCGCCPSCKKISQLVHPDLHFYFPNAATSRVKDKPSSADFQGEFRQFVDENHGRGTFEQWLDAMGIENKQAEINVRDADDLTQTLGLKAYEGGWKMAVVWMAEKMRTDCANKLLKTLEEPSERTVILLVGESDERMLPTIRSRVQTIRLHPGGNHHQAEDNEEFGPLLVEWLRLLFKLKMKDLAAQVDKMAAMNREQQKQFLSYTLDTMRECFLHSTAGLPCHLHSGDEKFDAQFPKMVTVNNIEMINSALNDTIFAISRNAYAKIALMELSFRMSRALKKR